MSTYRTHDPLSLESISIFSPNVLAVLDCIHLDMTEDERPKLGDIEYVNNLNIDELPIFKSIGINDGSEFNASKINASMGEYEQYLKTARDRQNGKITNWEKATLSDIDLHRLEQDTEFFDKNKENIIKWRCSETGKSYLHHIIRFNEDEYSLELIKKFIELIIVKDRYMHYPLELVIEKGFAISRDSLGRSKMEKSVFQISYPKENKSSTLTPLEKSVFGYYKPPKIVEIDANNKKTNVENAQKYSVSSLAHRTTMEKIMRESQVAQNLIGSETNNDNKTEVNEESAKSNDLTLNDLCEESKEQSEQIETLKSKEFIEKEEIIASIYSLNYNLKSKIEIANYVKKILELIPKDFNVENINYMIEEIILNLSLEWPVLIHILLSFYRGTDEEKRKLSIKFVKVIEDEFRLIKKNDFSKKTLIQHFNKMMFEFCHDETAIFNMEQYEIELKVRSINF